MEKASELSAILIKSEFKEEAEQFADFLEYFADSKLLTTSDAKTLVNQMIEALSDVNKTSSSYFNYYVSSYFKDP